MSKRRTLKVAASTFDRFARFKRPGENTTDALARLLDYAGVPETLMCEECGTSVQAHARDDDGRIMCFDCAGVSADALSD